MPSTNKPVFNPSRCYDQARECLARCKDEKNPTLRSQCQRSCAGAAGECIAKEMGKQIEIMLRSAGVDEKDFPHAELLQMVATELSKLAQASGKSSRS